MKFVIFHGAYGSADGNWFPQLKESLTHLGQDVIIASFPTENWAEFVAKGKNATSKKQSLSLWMKEFEKIRKTFKKDEKIVFVGHSLGPLFILHLVSKYHIRLDSAIFVSPFLDELGAWQFDNINRTFYKNDFDFKKLQALVPLSYTLYSDNDPYVPLEKSKNFAEKMGSSTIIVRNAGHLNSEVNLNEFPLVLEICKTRLELSLYQKYLAHRRELYSIEYIKGKNEEVVYLTPEEIFNEGVFKFRNLRRRGFCTFYTGLNFWDAHAKYFEEARKAAKRIGDFTRVFVIDKASDLDKSSLKEQIKLDLESGMKVYACNAREVIQEISGEPDFGIWDDEYVCIVEFDKKNTVSRVRISSRKEDIKKAKAWEEMILKKAKKISNKNSTTPSQEHSQKN